MHREWVWLFCACVQYQHATIFSQGLNNHAPSLLYVVIHALKLRSNPETRYSNGQHRDQYSSKWRILSLIRCKIAFSLIDSAIACLRAPRSAFHAPTRDFNLMDHPLTSSVLRSSFRPKVLINLNPSRQAYQTLINLSN